MTAAAPIGMATTKYGKWADELRRQIRAGELRPGDQLPSYTEMRTRHGVSRATQDRIHAVLAEEKLIVREPGRGVFVSTPQAREQTGMIGCLSFPLAQMQNLPDDRYYWSHLLDGITSAIHEAERQLVMFSNFSSQDSRAKVDGILVTGWNSDAPLPDLPCVSLLYEVPGITTLTADHEAGVQAATEHLLSLGHRRIGCLLHSDNKLSRRRIDRYRQTLLRAGIEPAARWERSLSEPDDQQFNYLHYGEVRMRDWLREDWTELGLTALLTENDQTAIGALAACRKAGVRVPEDVSIIGHDGTERSLYTSPALTTVEVPLFQIGQRGARELLRQIGGSGGNETKIVLPTRLVVRESTAPRGSAAEPQRKDYHR